MTTANDIENILLGILHCHEDNMTLANGTELDLVQLEKRPVAAVFVRTSDVQGVEQTGQRVKKNWDVELTILNTPPKRKIIKSGNKNTPESYLRYKIKTLNPLAEDMKDIIETIVYFLCTSEFGFNFDLPTGVISFTDFDPKETINNDFGVVAQFTVCKPHKLRNCCDGFDIDKIKALSAGLKRKK